MEKVRESSSGVIVSTDTRHIRPNPSWQHREQSPTLREDSDSFFFLLSSVSFKEQYILYSYLATA